jgi:hypothetical protein
VTFLSSDRLPGRRNRIGDSGVATRSLAEGQPAMSCSVSATWSGAENIAQ